MQYFARFPKIRENKFREKYFLVLTAELNPREKYFLSLENKSLRKILSPTNRKNKSPQKILLVFAKLKKIMLIEGVDSQSSYTFRSCNVPLPIQHCWFHWFISKNWCLPVKSNIILKGQSHIRFVLQLNRR